MNIGKGENKSRIGNIVGREGENKSGYIAGNIFLFIAVIILFMICLSILKIFDIFSSSMEKVNELKCSPLFMPFADIFGIDSKQNMEECTKKSSVIGANDHCSKIDAISQEQKLAAAKLRKDHEESKDKINKLNKATSTASGGLKNMTSGIMIRFKKTIYHFVGLTKKIMASGMTLTNVASTGILLGNSIVNGPIVKTMERLCFHPNTIIRLKGGTQVTMKNSNIGDILENGSKIIGKIDMDNKYNDCFYEIKDGKNSILVTGSHLMFDISDRKFKEVKNISFANKTNKTTPIFHCLITDDHLIKIGEHVFWDWED